MSWNVAHIDLTYDKHTFKFEPKQCFNVDGKYIVIIYNLLYTSDEIRKEAAIPYYVSTGETNQLRANMLFPFLCFTNNKLDEPICPYVSDMRLAPVNGLIKLSVVYNLNLTRITNGIYNECVSLIMRHLGKTEQNAKEDTDQVTKNINGISSILIRIINLLDFIISTSTSVLIDYIPSSDNILEQLKCYVPYPQPDQYNMAKCDASVDYNAEMIYRQCVLNCLSRMIKSLGIKYTYSSMRIEPITFGEYNATIINVCNYLEPYIKNLSNYREISDILHRVICEHNVNFSQTYLLEKNQLEKRIPKETELEATVLNWTKNAEEWNIPAWRLACMPTKIRIKSMVIRLIKTYDLINFFKELRLLLSNEMRLGNKYTKNIENVLPDILSKIEREFDISLLHFVIQSIMNLRDLLSPNFIKQLFECVLKLSDKAPQEDIKLLRELCKTDLPPDWFNQLYYFYVPTPLGKRSRRKRSRRKRIVQ